MSRQVAVFACSVEWYRVKGGVQQGSLWEEALGRADSPSIS